MDVKAKYLLLVIRILRVETEFQRLGDVARVGFPKHLDLTCAKLRALVRNSVKIAHYKGNEIACNSVQLIMLHTLLQI